MHYHGLPAGFQLTTEVVSTLVLRYMRKDGTLRFGDYVSAILHLSVAFSKLLHQCLSVSCIHSTDCSVVSISNMMEGKFNKEQGGFRNGKCCMDFRVLREG